MGTEPKASHSLPPDYTQADMHVKKLSDLFPWANYQVTVLLKSFVQV